jgi:hypothetical protein
MLSISLAGAEDGSRGEAVRGDLRRSFDCSRARYKDTESSNRIEFHMVIWASKLV